MSGTKAGGKKTAKTSKERYGEDFFKNIGSKGGAIKNSKKGFGSNPALARVAGRKGGLHRWPKLSQK